MTSGLKLVYLVTLKQSRLDYKSIYRNPDWSESGDLTKQGVTSYQSQSQAKQAVKSACVALRAADGPQSVCVSDTVKNEQGGDRCYNGAARGRS